MLQFLLLTDNAPSDDLARHLRAPWGWLGLCKTLLSSRSFPQGSASPLRAEAAADLATGHKKPFPGRCASSSLGQTPANSFRASAAHSYNVSFDSPGPRAAALAALLLLRRKQRHQAQTRPAPSWQEPGLQGEPPWNAALGSRGWHRSPHSPSGNFHPRQFCKGFSILRAKSAGKKKHWE